MSNNYYLNKSAKEAYKSYIREYDSHSLKVVIKNEIFGNRLFPGHFRREQTGPYEGVQGVRLHGAALRRPAHFAQTQNRDPIQAVRGRIQEKAETLRVQTEEHTIRSNLPCPSFFLPRNNLYIFVEKFTLRMSFLKLNFDVS